jgi:hypothetical protein
MLEAKLKRQLALALKRIYVICEEKRRKHYDPAPQKRIAPKPMPIRVRLSTPAEDANHRNSHREREPYENRRFGSDIVERKHWTAKVIYDERRAAIQTERGAAEAKRDTKA